MVPWTSLSITNYFYVKSGRLWNRALDQGVRLSTNYPFGLVLKCLSNSAINYLNYPICANKPSGTRTVPNSFPFCDLKTITSAISATTS